MNQAAIAFLDVLGFKGIWQGREPSQVINILEKVAPRVVQKYQDNLSGQNIPFEMSPPAVTILSDTIVLVIESDNPLCLAILSSSILDLFDYFAGNGLFFRGAISYGQFIQNGSTFIGPAVDDVATWYAVADWIGVIATPKTSYKIDSFKGLKLIFRENNNKSIPCFIKYQVPTKTERTHFHLNSLNWPGYMETRFQEVPDGVCGALKTMQGFFSNQAPFNASVFQKYENTLQFIEFWYENYGEKK